MEYASKGVAGAGLGLGIAGTAIGVLNGGLGNILGTNNWRNNGCGCNGAAYDHAHYEGYNRYDAEKDAKIARLETEVQLRDANTFTMGEMNKLRDYVDANFKEVRNELCEQKVFNEKTISGLGCLTGQVQGLQAVLNSITRTVVPNRAICPGWGDVTVSVTPTTTTTPAAGA